MLRIERTIEEFQLINDLTWSLFDVVDCLFDALYRKTFIHSLIGNHPGTIEPVEICMDNKTSESMEICTKTTRISSDFFLCKRRWSVCVRGNNHATRRT